MHSLHRVLAPVVAPLLALGAGLTPLAAQSTSVQPVSAAAIRVSTAAATGAALPLTLAPFKRGDMLFNTDANGSLYVRNGRDARPKLLLAAGSYDAVAPSNDGKYIAYTLPGSAASGAGSDLRVRSIETGRDLSDVLHNTIVSRKPWTHNEKGFFYTREDPADRRQRVYYHSLGKDQSRDAVVLSQMDQPEWRYDASVSDDGHFAVFTISHPADAHTRLYFIDLDNPGRPTLNAPIVRLIDAFSARYSFVDNAGSYFFLQTDRDAPLGSVVLANTDMTRVSSWPVVIPQSADTLVYVRTAGDEFVLPVYRVGTANVARVYGPPDPAAMRAEFQKRIDSLRKERADAEREGRRDRDISDAMRMRAPAAIRLERGSDFPVPAGASIVAMNTIADNEEVFYTLRMPDGSTRSLLYNIKNRRSEPFPSGAQTR
ncbi:MAG: hypothetical protein ACR2M1_11850 [Gemmatimonadaceae bacterium]